MSGARPDPTPEDVDNCLIFNLMSEDCTHCDFLRYAANNIERTEARLAEAERLLLRVSWPHGSTPGGNVLHELPDTDFGVCDCPEKARAFLAGSVEAPLPRSPQAAPAPEEEKCDYCQHPIHRDGQCSATGCMCAGAMTDHDALREALLAIEGRFARAEDLDEDGRSMAIAILGKDQLDLIRAALAAPQPALDVERLARAIDNFMRRQDGFDVDDAHAIAAEYERLGEKEK